MKPETERWLKLANEDGLMAKAALDDKVYRPSVFHSQQMLEKTLKAIWVEERDEGYPPKEHKLLALAREIGLELGDEVWEFLADLSEQYNPTRYGDVMLEYSHEQAQNYYQRASEICEQLLAQLT